MKYLLLFYVACIGIVIATDPKDVCDTCVLKEKCQVYGNMSKVEQQSWVEKFPCTSPEESNLGSPPGFAAAAKGDYVCCSNKIWGITKLNETNNKNASDKLTQNRYPNYNDDDDGYGNYNRPNYNNRPGNGNYGPNNRRPNNNFDRPNNNWGRPNQNQWLNNRNPNGINNNDGIGNGRNWNDGNGRNGNDRPGNYGNGNNNNGNYQNPPYLTEGPGFLGPTTFGYQGNNNPQTTPPRNVNDQGNSFSNFGQCDRVTSLPPDPQSGCCGREASDDDRITEPNAPTDIGYPSTNTNYPPNNVGNPIDSGEVPNLLDYRPGGLGNAPIDNGFAPIDSGFTPGTSGYIPRQVNNGFPPVDNGFPPVDNGFAPIDSGFAPGTSGNIPRQVNNGFPPVDNGFAPIDSGFAPGTSGNIPRHVNNGYPPIDNGFAPRDVDNTPRDFDNAPVNNGFAPDVNNNYPPRYIGQIPVNNGYLPPNSGKIPIHFGYPPNNGPSNNDNESGSNSDENSAPRDYDDDGYLPLWTSKDKTEVPKNIVPLNSTAEVQVENRISGGIETELYQFPWTVLLLAVFDYGNKQSAFNCGGSLISSKFVLTAGHCIYDKGAVIKSVAVYLAEYDRRTFPRDCKMTSQGRKCVDNVIMYAENVIRHPQYDDDGLLNDIGLIKLSGNAPYTDYIRPICLPPINIDDPQYSNLRLTVAGWGRNGKYKSDIKQSTVVNLVPQNECKRFYPSLSTRHLCAAGYKGEDTCKGDSGGPLMTLYRGKYYVVGVVSGKRSDSPCGTSVPSLYTNVYHYLDWIRNNVRN